MERRAAGTVRRLGPEVTKILFVKNLPFKIKGEELFEIFGRFGAIQQVRLGNSKETAGSAFVVFEDIFDAKRAMDDMNGFKVGDRFLKLNYFKVKQGTLIREI